MAEQKASKPTVTKFAGIEVPPDLTKGNFFFLYFNTLLVGLLMVIPSILQPAFLKDIIKVSMDFFGSINGLLQNMSQIATLIFVGYVGMLSDRVGRKILAIIGFAVLAIFFYLFLFSNQIAAAFGLPVGFSSAICAALSFAPSRAAEFNQFGQGLLAAYVIRLIIGIGLVLVYPQFITMVADYVAEKDRGKGMAFNGMMMGLGSLLIFGIVAPIGKTSGVAVVFYISSAIAVAGVIFTTLGLKERLPEKKPEKKSLMEVLKVANARLPLKASYLCSLITRADIVVIATFLVSWAVKSADQYNLTSEAATLRGSIPMIVMGVFSMIIMPVVGILIDKWGRMPTITLSLFLGGVGLILIGLCPSPFSGLVYPAILLAGFGLSGAVIGANTLAADASPKGMVGSILGGLNTMQPIGVLFFLGLGGYLFDAFGPGWAFGLKGVATLILVIWMVARRESIAEELKESASLASLPFTMEWEDEAKKMLEKVPGAFREAAVKGTEEYARQHSHGKITREVMEAYRKELGM
jgi:MFS family permease